MWFSCALLAVSLVLAGTARGGEPYCKSFYLVGIDRLILRAHMARQATIYTSTRGDSVFRLCGIFRGGARGYHSPTLGWKETPASGWGLDFESKKYERTLVISTVREIEYIHHYYYLGDLTASIPSGVTIQLVPRKLNGDSGPDLSAP